MISIRELVPQDEIRFIDAMKKSQKLHYPWIKPPTTADEFQEFIRKNQCDNQKSFLVLKEEHIVGVFNVNEIVRGVFQNAFLGFYAVADFSGKGHMNAGLKLVLKKCFKELKLHRIEANIQPGNSRSIQLVKSNKFRYEGFSPRYLMINGVWCGHERWALTYEEYIQDDPEVTKKDHINIMPYDPHWPMDACEEIERIRSIFPPHIILDIQHVGSTAIPGLSAKPIIDIQIAVDALDPVKIIAIPVLQKLGYEYWADNPDSTRMFFAKGMPPFGERRTHHVHIVELTSKHWREKILFRDYLFSHPEAAKEYANLKQQLAREHQYDREQYTDAKTAFIHRIIANFDS